MTIRLKASRGSQSIGAGLKKSLKNLDERITLRGVDAFYKKLGPLLEQEVKKSISSGKSPVSGEGRFEKYSKSYKQKIKRGLYPGKKIRPVNLKLSGQLLASWFYRKLARGKYEYGFKDKLAKIHSRMGAGKSKIIRKMLPGRGEKFNRTISLKIRSLLGKTLRKYARRR